MTVFVWDVPYVTVRIPVRKTPVLPVAITFTLPLKFPDAVLTDNQLGELLVMVHEQLAVMAN